LIVWAVEAFGLIILVDFIPGPSVNSFETALAAAVVFGSLNAIFWPILSRFTFPFFSSIPLASVRYYQTGWGSG
jgi:putative membrane protein